MFYFFKKPKFIKEYMHHNIKGEHSVKNIIFDKFFEKIYHIYLIFPSFVTGNLFLSNPAIYINI